jgi:hypothetical protein
LKSHLYKALITLASCLTILGRDSVVVFNELMYHPAGNDSLEWVELYNQMAVDVELSGWRIDGIDYTFPTNSIIGGGKYLVVASNPALLQQRTGLTNVFGPFSGKLANEGEQLRLLNHNKRIMDEVEYEIGDPWPVAPDGSGFTLAKKNPDSGSGASENWITSAEFGGTPGNVNFGGSSFTTTLQITELAGSTNSPFWFELHNSGLTQLSLIGYEISFLRAIPKWIIPSNALIEPGGYAVIYPDTAGLVVAAGNKLFFSSPGGTNFVDAVEIKRKTIARSPMHDGNWLTPARETPGAVNEFSLEKNVVINEILYHARPLESRPALYQDAVLLPMDASWRYNQSGGLPAADWFTENYNDSSWPAGTALLYHETAPLPGPNNTPLNLGPITFYLRTEFQLGGDITGAELYLEHVIDDGAIFYLNGRELYRFNMPAGTVSDSTFASPGVTDATLVGPVVVSPADLKNGPNVLAVEVHQNSEASSDIVFGAKLGIRQLIQPAHGLLENPEQWIELFNKGTNRVDLSGWSFKHGVDFDFPTNTFLEAGTYLVLANDTNAFRSNHPSVPVVGPFSGKLSHSSDWLELRDFTNNPVDSVRYFDGPPWPEFADGFGSSLELRDPEADNSKAEAWGASVTSGDWQAYTYSMVAAADGGPTRWNEFVFGLLDSGSVLLDDFSVIENPTGGARELLQNGNFENGVISWRFLGTHRNATIIVDPDNPANHVLQLIADGPTEHMHNHVETTYANNTPIQNGSTYKISFRAKWLAGCNKLNTRLYFNRVARTTSLQIPSKTATPGMRNSTFSTNIGPTFTGLRHFPIVPTTSQPVTVSVHAAAPSGVKRCTLWWGQNGTTWTSAPMTETNGLYGASIPALPTATTVQFYIEAEDQTGSISQYPAGGRGSRALYRVKDSQTLSTRIHNFRLLMLPSEATALHALTNVMSNGRSPCTVIYDEREVYYNCALHLQASERGRDQADRVGFTVNFPEDHLFRGVQDSITFDRSGGWSGKGGKQDEMVLRHIINQAGDSPDMYNDLVRVLTPLSTHTGTAMLLMTKYNSSFFDHTSDTARESLTEYPPDGSQFKLELIYYPTSSVGNNPQAPKIPEPDDVIGDEIRNRGDDPEAYRWFFLSENNPWRNDYSALITLAKTFDLSGTALQQQTSALLDMDQWIRVFAFKSLGGDADTYAFGYPHNQIIYLPPQGKALTFPWDMDFAWTRSATDPITVGARIGQIIHGVPVYHRLFLGHIRDIIDSSYNTNYMTRWANHYASLASQNYSGVVTYIGQREKSARSQLPAEAPFRITSFNGSDTVTNASTIRLIGTAPYTIKRFERPTPVSEPDLNWITADQWQWNISLEFGENRIALNGYNFRNQAVTGPSITITSSNPYGRPDRDGDGMPDTWETLNGTNPDVSDSAKDPDGDGLSNLDEYLAGTSPFNSGDRLFLEGWQNQQQLELSFFARAGRRYRVEYRVGLESPWQQLSVIGPELHDRGVSLSQTVSAVAPAIFYRVVLGR